MRPRTQIRRIALLAIGVALGIALAGTPASAHIGGSISHLVGHLKPYFFTKAQSDTRYVNALPGTDKANTAAQADNATSADYADNAGSADFASEAQNAESATTAQTAGTALNANNLGSRTPADFDDAVTLAGRTAADFDDAATLGGRAANGLVRVARTTATGPNSDPGFVLTFSEQTFGTLSITAPSAGFVLVTSSLTVDDSASCTTSCDVSARIRHASTQASNIAQTSVEGRANLSNNLVLPVAAGVQTFDLKVRRENNTVGDIEAIYAEMSAIFVPFGATGGSTLN